LKSSNLTRLSTTEISIIVCTKQRKEHLNVCLESILRSLKGSSWTNYQIIVVDGKSTDGTKDLVAAYSRQNSSILYVIQNGKGLPNARNYGLEFAKGKIIVFLDDDVIVSDSYFKSVNRDFVETVGGISGAYQKQDDDTFRGYQFFKAQLDRLFVGGWNGKKGPIGRVFVNGSSTCNFENAVVVTDVDRLTGCNMIYSRRVIDKCGLFDETFEGNIAEDADFSFRVKKLGYRLVVDPDLKLIHEDVDDRVFPFSESCLYYSGLSNLHFFFKHTYGGDFSSLSKFVYSNCYISLMYFASGLVCRRPLLGTRYLAGFLRALQMKRRWAKY
jgi:glycosyltransferase involved in cell wall biosynthesis